MSPPSQVLNIDLSSSLSLAWIRFLAPLRVPNILTGSFLTCQEQMLSSLPPRGPVPSQIHRRLLFAKSRSQAVSRVQYFQSSTIQLKAVSKTESLKSSEASPALGLSPADSSKCIITLSSFEVELLKKLSHIILGGRNAFNIFPIKKHVDRSLPLHGCFGLRRCVMSVSIAQSRI